MAHLALLSDLLTAFSTPEQMRVVCVGLVKEAVLTALSSSEPSPFASPLMLQTLGPVLFRPDPVNLFEKEVELAEFVDSGEPKRLTECLSFYYVLLMRDAHNVVSTNTVVYVPLLRCYP
jgi:hypothetical protein